MLHLHIFFYVILYAYIYKIFKKGSILGIKINAKVGIKLDIEQAYLLSYDQLKFAFIGERERERRQREREDRDRARQL